MGISTSRLRDRCAYRGRIDGEYRMRAPSAASRSRTRGWRTATGPTPVMISRCGRWPWRTTRCWPVSVLRSVCFARNSATSASTAWVSSARAPLRRISVRESVKAPGWASLMTLLSDTAYHSFIGEVEALNTTTIRRLTRSRCHQLLAIALARQQPALMIFEDLHWADPTSRELLDMTVEQIERIPLLLIATFRPEFQPPWTGQPHVMTLSLRHLGQQESRHLAREIMGNHSALSSEVVDEIVARTDGVPLFLEELTKAVIEAANAGGNDGSGAILSVPATSLAVPATLHISLMARLDRLGPTSKEVVQIGAAIGREFHYELLAAVAPRTERELGRCRVASE